MTDEKKITKLPLSEDVFLALKLYGADVEASVMLRGRVVALELDVAASKAALGINDGFLTGVEEKLEKAEQRAETAETIIARRDAKIERQANWITRLEASRVSLREALAKEEAND